MNTHLIEQHGFQLLEQIEDTSRTVVWKAIQNTLDRTVIIRVLKPHAAATPSEVDHFLSIARRFARVKSDSLAAVFDIVSEGDLHYVVMEHVEGPTLEELVSERGPLPADQILRIAASLVTSLEQMWNTAHIVHRNLKSATIRLDPRGVAKITDFSLAMVAGPGVDATAMDGGHIVGTPCFLSPEQAQGTHMLNTQSDMYALGAVLYHLSTGKVPFEEREVFAILAGHVKEQVPPPHRLNHAIPVNFSWFVHRLMMKNPNSRYANWDDVLLDIRHMLAGTPPSCVRPDEEFLSTIAMDFDEAQAASADQNAAPRVRLNRKDRSRKLAAYQEESLSAEQAQLSQDTDLPFQWVCWGVLAVWLVLVFWFRAVYQMEPKHAEISRPAVQANETVTLYSDESEAPHPSAPPVQPAAEAGHAPSQPTAAPAVATPSEPAPQTPAAPPPEAKPALPTGIPAALKQGLAQALANADFATARQLARTSPDRFQEKEALLALLDELPEPDALVAEYLKNQIGKPLTLERGGKQRAVIVRGVENGVIQVEANGRGAELAIEKLSADEKINWMNKPGTPAESAAYCVTLMRSSRRAEVYARASACPLLAPVLIEAAGRVPEAKPPAE